MYHTEIDDLVRRTENSIDTIIYEGSSYQRKELYKVILETYARMAKLADASDLRSDVFGRGGSSPSTRTNLDNM